MWDRFYVECMTGMLLFMIAIYGVFSAMNAMAGWYLQYLMEKEKRQRDILQATKDKGRCPAEGDGCAGKI